MEYNKKKERKTDRRTIYTKNVIKDALLECLGKKFFEKITVTEVCHAAEITRATFYLHFETLTDVLDELLNEALRISEQDSLEPDADVNQVIRLLADKDTEHLKKHESFLPVCHRVAHLPKYHVIFKDETISDYVVSKIYQWQKKELIPAFMCNLHLTQKQAEMLLLFVINGTYKVNKSLNWTKNDTWYEIHSMLLKFTAGGYGNLQKQSSK